MTIQEAIKYLEGQIVDPRVGLPSEIFYFITRLTPMVNVDLLIKDENGRSLLSWRDDKFSGSGWHIPGGIVRYKEKMKNRLNEVAKQKDILFRFFTIVLFPETSTRITVV